jgi:hypothetical protein
LTTNRPWPLDEIKACILNASTEFALGGAHSPAKRVRTPMPTTITGAFLMATCYDGWSGAVNGTKPSGDGKPGTASRLPLTPLL